MGVLVYQPTAILTSTWLQTVLKDHLASLGETSGQHVDSPTVVGFIGQDYCYKSIASKILHDVGLEEILYTG